MSGWLRRLGSLVAGVAVVWLAVSWLSGGCERRIEPGEVALAGAPAAGDTVVVRAVEAVALEWVSGTLRSARSTTISSKILARIEDIQVRAGSVVAAGDPLVTLDARDLEARVREAEEGLRGAQAELALARAERARIEELFAARVASRQQLDRALSAARVAEAAAQAAQQRLTDAQVLRSFGEIRSPVSGRVVERLAEPGDTASPGTPLIEIYDPSALRLEAPVRESLAVTLAPGRTLEVAIDALGERFEGTIEEIVPFAEPGARTLLVKVRLPSDARLYAGMFGRLAVPAGERTRLLVPAAAVERVGQLEFVQVVTPGGTLERRLLTTGARDGADLEVLSGLAAGERVALAAAATAGARP